MARYEEHMDQNLVYQRYLQDREKLTDADHYYYENQTPRRSVLALGLALVAGGAAGVLAFRHGLFSGVFSRGASLLGQMGTGGPLSVLSRGLYTWSRETRPGLSEVLHRTTNLSSTVEALGGWLRDEVASLRQHIVAARADIQGWQGAWRASAIEASINEMEVVLRAARRHWEETYGARRFAQDIQGGLQKLQGLMMQAIREHYHIPAEELGNITRRFGVRPATVAELGGRGLINKDVLAFAQQHQLLQLVADPHVLVNPRTGEIHDLRPFVQTILRQVRGFERHFALPIVRFNPLSLFYVEEIAGLERKPLIYSFVRGAVQPTATGTTRPADNLVYIAGHVYDLTGGQGPTIKRLTDVPGQLINARRYLAKQHIRSLYGIPAAAYVMRRGRFAGRYANIMRRLGLGFQDIAEYEGEDVIGIHELFTKGIAERFWRRFGPYEQKFSMGNQPFGVDERWLFIQKARWDPAGFLRQLTAHRGRPQDVSPLTLVPYTFFARINTMLGPFGLALPIEDTSSAWSIYGNLLLKRILPALAIPFAWHYLNYETQNLTGVRPEDVLADAYAGTTVGAARLSDVLGITPWLKRVPQLFPGSEQITEFPLFAPFTVWMGKTAEEMQAYWERGEEPVRKGRYWPLGNSPITGGRIQYWRPNWIRRLKSRWQYTDVLYGSETEYFAHAPFPTPRFPAAPIRHFITQPYWLEEKHYIDRPYPITGDIPELAEFPLIGPILGWLGRIFKPPRKMHPEFWSWVEAGVIPQPEGYPEQYVTDAYRRQQSRPKQALGVTAKAAEMPEEEKEEERPAAVRVPAGQWGLAAIGAPYAAAGEGRGTAVVAVIDTGVDIDHPALRGRLLPGYNAVTGTQDVTDEYGHGTHVAGIISGVTAAAGRRGYDVKILPIKASNEEGVFSPEALSRAIEYAINWRGPHGERVSVINMSLGTPVVNAAEQQAIQRAYEAGIMPVVAAGNESLELHVGAPAIWPEALAVGALKKPAKEGEEPRLAPYSNRGIGLDVTAPGSEIPSAYPDDTYETLSGTSMAAPHVAAAVALLRAARPELPPGAIRYIIQATAADLGKSGDDSQYGAGGLDLGLADAILRRMDRRERAQLIAAAEMENRRIAVQRAVLLNYIRNQQANRDVYYVNQKIVDQYGRTVQYEQSPGMTLRALLENIKEFAGFYGFVPDIVYESQYRRIPRLATSRALESYRRRWWEEELGGLGGDVNEVLRRFTGKKEFWAEYFNPLPNRMPSWLPGPEYMVDYHTGDPYLKHSAGEYRLPGGGYEALYNVPMAEAIKADPLLRLADRLGLINRLEYYDPFNRFRILASVAPWSEEYKQYSRLMEEIDLTPEQKEEVKEIRARVRALKKPLRVYPYRFLHKHLQRETVTVEKVIDANTFYVKEYPDHPIRLAGIHVPTGKDDEAAQKAAEFLIRHIYPGAKITIAYDRERKIADDTYQTIRAVVYSGNINLNLALLHQGLAKEKETDYSAAGIVARFTPEALLAGKLWERFVHLDTILHTKFLQVPSPAEDWWRREVYGKRLQRWERAGRDYVIPTYQSFIVRHPLIATASGMALGYMFGRTRYGKIVGTTLGGLLVGGGAIYRSLYEFFTGERWIPARRCKEWATEEYIDILKYIKYARLFAYEARAALEEEHFDVVAYLAEEKRQEEERKRRIEELEEAKRRLHKQGEDIDSARLAAELRVTIPEPEEDKEETPAKRLLRAINTELKALAQKPPEPELPPRAARALEFYRQMKSTMYGYEPGEPLGDFIAALPKKERRYFNYLAEAPEEEWRKVREVLPRWMLYGLAPARGEVPPPKPELAKYFEHHFLPGPEWPGWRADVSLQDVRVKLVRHEGMDVAEFDIWPDDEARAAMVAVPAPRAFRPAEHGRRLREKLAELLSGRGITDLDVLVEPADGGIDIDVEVEEDRSGEIAAYLNKDPRLLVR